MKPTLFPPELRTLSYVPRWSIVWTIREDSVSNHSFYVAIYSRMIAQTIHWKGPLDILLMKALVHDLEEVVTGDIVSPVKNKIVNDSDMNEFVDTILSKKMTNLHSMIAKWDDELPAETLDEIDQIIKAADRLDAVIFLTLEQRLGNGAVEGLRADAIHKLEGAWLNLPADKSWLLETWAMEIMTAIQLHSKYGGAGVP